MSSVDILKCEYCHFHYDLSSRRPKFLSCHHSFCLSCVQKLNGGNGVICPSCKKYTLCASGSNLEDNFYSLAVLNTLLDTLKIPEGVLHTPNFGDHLEPEKVKLQLSALIGTRQQLKTKIDSVKSTLEGKRGVIERDRVENEKRLNIIEGLLQQLASSDSQFSKDELIKMVDEESKDLERMLENVRASFEF